MSRRAIGSTPGWPIANPALASDRRRLQAEDALAVADNDVAQAAIDVFQSLGGGFGRDVR